MVLHSATRSCLISVFNDGMKVSLIELRLAYSCEILFVVEGWQSTYDPSRPHGRFNHFGAMVNNSRFVVFGGCVK